MGNKANIIYIVFLIFLWDKCVSNIQNKDQLANGLFQSPLSVSRHLFI